MHQRFSTQFFLACGVIGPLLFIAVFLIEGATRPGYSVWRHSVSQLSLGQQGWMNSINMFVCGLFLLCFAFGLTRTLHSGKGSVWGPRLTWLCGVLFLLAALFATNPALGYPPPLTPTDNVLLPLHGLIHALAGTLFFGCLTALCFVLGRRKVGDPERRGWALYSYLTGGTVAISYLATAVVTSLAMSGVWADAPGGLLERIALVVGFGWVMLLALHLLREKPLAEISYTETVEKKEQAKA